MTSQSDILNDKNYIPVLDHGFVGLVDSMGNDKSIVNAARVSYGEGTKKISDDTNLIRYLIRQSHTSPIEMVEFKFHCKMPIFIARQWVRHRTASLNEYSGRYSVMTDEFYVPKQEQLKPQSENNKQGRHGKLLTNDALHVQEDIKFHSDNSYNLYKILLNDGTADDGGVYSRSGYGENEDEGFPGVSRELARMVLPLNTYTEWYWKIDLHNLFHFLKLRMDSHAQWEIQEYGNALYKLIQPIVPIACQAFEDYILNAKKLSHNEMNLLLQCLDKEKLLKLLKDDLTLGKREKTEFLGKLNEKNI